eukprot:365557-Chlamydomonas_euryale.AAC.1
MFVSSLEIDGAEAYAWQYQYRQGSAVRACAVLCGMKGCGLSPGIRVAVPVPPGRREGVARAARVARCEGLAHALSPHTRCTHTLCPHPLCVHAVCVGGEGVASGVACVEACPAWWPASY